jgi:uncharacterized membrane protein YeaQ/YmgE (transglycosylase-associated protein family)
MQIVAFAPIAGHHLLAWIVIGVVAGMVASVVVRGKGLGLVRDLIVGIAGAVIGGLILHAVRGGPHTVIKLWQEIIVALIGAVILLLIIKLATRSSSRPLSHRR